MPASTHYDVIIIGTGAGGGTLAYKLAPSGKRILLLERGDFVPREKQNWDSHAVVVENRYHIKDAWLDKDGEEFHPWQTKLLTHNTEAIAKRVGWGKYKLLSPGAVTIASNHLGFRKAITVRDPDGHVMQIVEK